MTTIPNILKKILYPSTEIGVRFIEIYFTRKPRVALIEQLKKAGFRWSYERKCWFANANEITERIAQALNKWDLEEITAIIDSMQREKHIKSDHRYNERTGKQRQREIPLRVPSNEYAEIHRILQEHNISALDLFRKAVEELKKDSQ